MNIKKLLIAAITSTALVASAVTVSWDPNPEPDIAGYTLYWGTSTNSMTNTLTVGAITTNVVLSDLQFNFMQTNYFTLTASNTSGLTSDPSDPVPWFRKNFIKPGKVQGIKIPPSTKP